MYPLRPQPELLESTFLLLHVLGEGFSRFAEAVSMRSGFPKINRDELGQYFSDFPDVGEQARISTIYALQQTRLDREYDYATKLQALKSALMHDLLTGRVRTTP